MGDDGTWWALGSAALLASATMAKGGSANRLSSRAKSLVSGHAVHRFGAQKLAESILRDVESREDLAQVIGASWVRETWGDWGEEMPKGALGDRLRSRAVKVLVARWADAKRSNIYREAVRKALRSAELDLDEAQLSVPDEVVLAQNIHQALQPKRGR
jgi:hypothetical protein